MTQRTLNVTAFAIAETFQPRNLASVIGGEPVELTKSRLLVRAGDGWIAVHDFGAIVFVGVEDDEARASLDKMLRASGVTSTPRLAESFVLEVRPGATPSVAFDRVVVPAIDPAQLALITHVIGQSVATEHAEADVDALLAETDTRARSLASAGARGIASRGLLRFVGRAMTVRTQVVHTLALLDPPASVWESEPLDRLHRALRAAFDIDERYRGLDHKLRVVQENLALLADLAQHRRSAALEIAVVALIAFEIVLGIVGRH